MCRSVREFTVYGVNFASRSVCDIMPCLGGHSFLPPPPSTWYWSEDSEDWPTGCFTSSAVRKRRWFVPLSLSFPSRVSRLLGVAVGSGPPCWLVHSAKVRTHLRPRCATVHLHFRVAHLSIAHRGHLHTSLWLTRCGTLSCNTLHTS